MGITVSAKQFRALEADCHARFLQRLCDLAQTLRPDLAQRASGPLMREFAAAMTTRARQIGFSTEFEIAVYFSACLLLGKDWSFDTTSELAAVVHQTDTQPHLRAAHLLYQLERAQALPAPSH